MTMNEWIYTRDMASFLLAINGKLMHTNWLERGERESEKRGWAHILSTARAKVSVSASANARVRQANSTETNANTLMVTVWTTTMMTMVMVMVMSEPLSVDNL